MSGLKAIDYFWQALNRDHGRCFITVDNISYPAILTSTDVSYSWDGYEFNFEGELLKGEPVMPTKKEFYISTSNPYTDFFASYCKTDVDLTQRAYSQLAGRKSPIPAIKAVHFSGPVTVVIWADKTKTIVRCNGDDTVDYEKGLAMAIAKKVLGTNKSGSNYYDIFKKYLPKPESEDEENAEV